MKEGVPSIPKSTAAREYLGTSRQPVDSRQGRSHVSSFLLACGLALGLGGCRQADSPAASTAIQPDLLLYCGAGIRPPVEELTRFFETRHTAKVATDYSGSQVLLAKIKVSGVGDLYLPGDKYYVDQAADAGLIRRRQPVCYFVPTILVQKDNPKHIQGLSDLAREGVKLGLGNPEACAIGRISKRLLAKNHIAWETIEKNLVFQSLTVNELGMQIQAAALDAVLVWDAIAHYYRDYGEIIPIPVEWNIISTVEVAILQSVQAPALAEAFLDLAVSAEGQAIFRKHQYRVEPPK